MAQKDFSSQLGGPRRPPRPSRPPRPVPQVPSQPLALLPGQYNEEENMIHAIRQDSSLDLKSTPSSRTAFWKQAKYFIGGRENGKLGVKRRICIVFLVITAFITVFALILRIFVRQGNGDSGIATISFSLTDKLIQGHITNHEEAERRDLIDPGDMINNLKSAAEPAASQVIDGAKSITSEVPELATKVKSAAMSAATSLQGTIEKSLPQNLSLGTYRFCVGFIDTIDCKRLPLNLSDLLPASVEDLPGPFTDIIKGSMNTLQPAATALTNIAYIRAFLIVGLILLFIFVALVVASTLGRVLCIVGILIGLSRRSKVIIHVIFGLICSAPLAVAAVILLVFKRKADVLPPWVKIDYGEVGELCLGSLCCAIVLTIITAVSPALIHG